MAEEACPVDLPEQGVQPMVTVVTSTGGAGSSEVRVDEQHPTDPAAQQ